MGKEIVLTDANFSQEVLEAGLPVLVDFWAEWCAPCRMIGPVVEEIANEFSTRVIVGKINVDQNRGITEKYGIRSIPTLLLFKGGQVVDQLVGLQQKSKLVDALQKVL